MINSPSLTVAFATIILFILAQRHVYATCDSPQYADYGQRGIIKCTFTPGFKGVFWYMSVNSEYQIILRLEQQEDGSMVPAGDGYTEGKFDVLPDGSLVILNNTNYHDQSFKIVLVDKNSLVEERHVEVLTRMISHHDFPVITVCNRTKLCVIDNTDVSILTCSFQHSKPPVEIQWYRQSHEGIDKLEAETLKTKDGKWTFSSTSSINVTSLVNGPLIALTCRVSSPALKSQTLESTVVIDTTEQPWPSLQEGVSEDKYFFIDSQAEVPCNDNAKPLIFVWKQLNRSDSKILSFATNDATGFVVNLDTTLNVTEDGSLIISSIHFENEGLYSCTFFDGTRYISDVKQVNVFVPPSPETIIADGCSKDKPECEIFLPDTISVFNISCRLFGVYPNVTLAMDNTLYSDTKQISRYTYSVERGSLYDCSVTNEFPPIKCSASMSVTCFLSRPGPLVALIQDKVISVRSEACEETGSKAPIIITSVLIVILLCICISTLLCYRRRIHTLREDIDKRQPRELEPLNSTSEENEGATRKKEPNMKDNSADSTNSVPEDTDEKETPEEEHTLSESQETKDQSKSDENEESKSEQVRKEERGTLPNDHAEKSSTQALYEETAFNIASEDSEESDDDEVAMVKAMKKALHSIMNYPMNRDVSKSVFDADVIEIVRKTPVKIEMKEVGSSAVTSAETTMSAFVPGASLGLTGAFIWLSSRDIFQDESKWKKVKPAFQTLIEIQRDIAKTIALTKVACMTINAFSNMKWGTHYYAKEPIANVRRVVENCSKHRHLSKKEDLPRILNTMVEDTEMILQTIKSVYPLEDNQVMEARDIPFKSLCEDILTCRIFLGSTSSFLDVIEMLFSNDKTGKVEYAVIQDINERTETEINNIRKKISHNISNIVKGVATAGIVLKAANVDARLEFLGTAVQNLLDSKHSCKTISLTETADLMEKMNIIFEKIAMK